MREGERGRGIDCVHECMNQGNLIRGEREGGDEFYYLGSFGLQCKS